MSPICIFTEDESLENSLWSFCIDSDIPILDVLFKFWADADALTEFFTEHQDELRDYYKPRELSIQEAVLKTIDEVYELQGYLLELIETGADEGIPNLDSLFKAFDNLESGLTELRLSKAQYQGRRGWLRIYAVRIAANCFIVTGGAIKLRQDMETDYLIKEKRSLQRGRDWCKENGVYEPQDLNEYF